MSKLVGLSGILWPTVFSTFDSSGVIATMVLTLETVRMLGKILRRVSLLLRLSYTWVLFAVW